VRNVSGMDLGHSHSRSDKPGTTDSDAYYGAKSVAMECLLKLTVEHTRWTFRFGGTG
jgi:hypothetical protein